MYVVIFRADIKALDDDYLQMAQQMRDLALNQYDCIEFTAMTEGQQEMALSYWHNENYIQKWKQDVQHIIAQKYGQEKWYTAYSVEICEIIRSYDWPNKNHSK